MRNDVIFYRIFPYCWEMIPKPPGDTCSRALEQWQRWPAVPQMPVLCPPVSLGRDWHSKITTAIQCIARWAEISSHHWCIFQTANCLLVISQGNCIPHRILSIHRTLLSLRGGYFNSSVMPVATRKQEEIEYEVHFLLVTKKYLLTSSRSGKSQRKGNIWKAWLLLLMEVYRKMSLPHP